MFKTFSAIHKKVPTFYLKVLMYKTLLGNISRRTVNTHVPTAHVAEEILF